MNVNRFTFLLVGVGYAFCASPVIAQSAGTPEQETGQEIQEIIVTAQRRDESLSKTPVSVAVLSGDLIEKAQIISEQDLRSSLPGLTVRASQNSNQLNYAVRGQSQDAYSGTRPGVLPYINEVQIGGSGASTAFYDLQSVQVLKGPQGTLFGRSATGGAVLFTTAKPTDTLGGYITGGAGNYDAAKFEGAINAPIIGDRLMARVAGFYQKRDGFQRNLFDGGREGDTKRSGLRGSLTGNLGSVKDELVVDYFNSASESTVAVVTGLFPLTSGSPTPTQLLYSGTATPVATITGQCTLQAFAQIPGPCPPAVPPVADFYNAYFAAPGHPNNGLSGVLADQKARGPYIADSEGRNLYNANNLIVSNATTFAVNDDTRIKNIFGYTNLRQVSAFDPDGTPYQIADLGPKNGGLASRVNTEQVSNELQLGGKALNDALDYVVGYYFADEKSKTFQQNVYFDLIFGGFENDNDFTIKNKTSAGYAQGTYQLNDSGLALTLGTRYTSEKVRLLILPRDGGRIALGDPAPSGFSYDQSETFNRTSWQVGLQEQFNPHFLLYAVSRRAYKSGGFNPTQTPKIGSAETNGNAYRAERATDAELGAKYEGDIGTLPTRFNVALFHSWVKDSQRFANSIQLGVPVSLTVNVPDARIYGVEFQGQIVPAGWLTLGSSLNYTHARYTSGEVFLNGAPSTLDQLPDTPKASGAIFADVTIPVSERLSLLAHADVYAQDKTFTSPSSINNFGTVTPSYTLANFRLGLEDKKAGWSVTANLKNAFDRVYYAGGLPIGQSLQINVLIPGEPRTFTLEGRLNF